MIAHWHYIDGVGEEGDPSWGITRTRHEAVTEYGRDDSFYIWACEDIECLDDIDWTDPVWRRND
jgi:hypothetical protein